MLVVSPEIRIPLAEIEFSFVRSSGPGGQNVNKVNSKAVLRWNLCESPSLTPELKARVLEKLGEKVTREGELVITGDSFRDQLRNRDDCLEKLRSLLASAAHRPKKRKKTNPSKSRQRKDREAKTLHSQKKSSRNFRGSSDSDD